MALSLRTTPEQDISLARGALNDALESFRKSLADDQRQRFDQLQSSPAKPTEDSVMILIAEIDGQSSGRFIRYVGPKLQPFLNCVQQFSAIVDNFIPCTPMIAQAVWGSVKCTLLLMSNFSQYFGKITDLFVSIGKKTPRLKELGGLYENHVRLQSALCFYFAEVVKLCQKAVKVFSRRDFVQIARAAFMNFEREFGESSTALNAIAQQIQEEASLASKKVQVEEAKLSALSRNSDTEFRKLFTGFSSRARQDLEDLRKYQTQSERRRMAMQRKMLKDKLCSLDPSVAWIRIKKCCIAGSAAWFEKAPAYREWLAHKGSSNLWYLSKMGSGKTTLTANIVSNLVQANATQALAYVFCQDEVSESLLATNIIGSIARQLLSPIIDLAEGLELERLVAEYSYLDIMKKASLILSNKRLSKTCFVVLDGLDQCPVAELDSTMLALKNLTGHLASDITMKIFISGRPELSTRMDAMLKEDFRLVPGPDDLNDDLAMYIEAALDTKLACHQLKLNDPSLISTIQDVLLLGAQTMYLWAFLLVEDLCLQNSDQEILVTLQNVPTKLSELFERLLGHTLSDELNSDMSLRILKWATGARRPLHIEELREALTIRPWQTFMDTLSLPNDLSLPILNCRGLVFIDEDDSTVHLVHHSLKQYLLTPATNERLTCCRFEREGLDNELALLCMTYLGFSDFKHDLVRISKSQAGLRTGAVAKGDLSETRARSSDTIQLARALLRSPKRVINRQSTPQTLETFKKELERISALAKMSASESKYSHRHLRFIEYAGYYWIYHGKNLQPTTTPLAWSLFERFISLSKVDCWPRNDLVQLPWTQMEWASHALTIGDWICDHNHLPTLYYLLNTSGSGPTDDELRHIILEAAKKGHVRLIEMLRVPCKRIWSLLEEALQFAAQAGHLPAVECFLGEEGPTVCLDMSIYRNSRGFTPRQAACLGPSVYLDLQGFTELQAAVFGGNLAVVDRLLRAGASPNIYHGRRSRAALRVAAARGNLEMVNRLIEAGAHINPPLGSYDRTALQAACEEGHSLVVDRLLQVGADVSAEPDDLGGCTALWLAAERGHLDIVERLLRDGAEVNFVIPKMLVGSKTALEIARSKGHLAVVERLIAAGALEV